MGFSDVFKKVIGIEEFNEDEELTEEDIQEAKENLVKKAEEDKNIFEKRETKFIPDFAKSLSKQSEERKQMLSSNKYSTSNTGSMKLLVIEPKSFDECTTLVDNLKAKKPIIVNLEKLETGTAKKIFDFLSGAVYALNGKVNKVTNNIFIFAPANVGISESRDNREKADDDSLNPWR